MSVHVPSLLLDQKTSKPISPVDIVMGTPWGEIELGNSLRLSLLYHVFREFQPVKQKSGRHTVRRGGPQSFVKVIRNGGTTNAKGMKAQMNYLTQKGEVELELSDLYFGAKLEKEEWDELIESWDVTGINKGDFDKTHHIVVSFPHHTDRDAAKRVGRAWAAEMFSSGNYGDVYDYYTAYHTDQQHPHMHIVVNRRGMEHGNWLSIHREGAFNYTTFRDVQVQLAAEEGINLQATSRYSRGVSDRPFPDAEYRRAEREGREPKAPSHSPISAMRAAASIALYAGQYSADAKLVRNQHPYLAKSLREMAATLLKGQELKPNKNPETHTSLEGASLEEAKKQSEFIMSRRSEILASIEEIDAEISTIPIGKDRSLVERDASRIKAEAAKHLPDVADLILHTRENPHGYYKGVDAQDGVENAIKEKADRVVADLARRVAVDPERFVSRYDRSSPASIGLADNWRKDELEDIQKGLTYQPSTPRSEVEELTQAAYDELHRNALQTYRKAERELEAHAAKKRELYRIAKLIREGGVLQPAEELKLRDTVKETLTTTELRELEAGQPKVLRHIAQNGDEQRALARRYLEGEHQEATGPRKDQLQLGIKQLDRDAQRLAEHAATQAQKSKDRGIDL